MSDDPEEFIEAIRAAHTLMEFYELIEDEEMCDLMRSEWQRFRHWHFGEDELNHASS
jgi:hypothetical protein